MLSAATKSSAVRLIILAVCAAGLSMGMMLRASPALAASPDFTALIASPDRSDADRQTDKRRNPVRLLAFTGAESGMTVLDMGAGGGYSTELMARAVGPSGKVYGQNAQERERFVERLKTPAMKKPVAAKPMPHADTFDKIASGIW